MSEQIYNYNENKEEYLPQYKEYTCPTFQNATERIIADDTNNKEKFILLDIDGVLLNNLDKLPAYSLINKSEIDDVDQAYIMHLKEIYKDKIAIVTDRNPKLNLFISSKYIVDKVKEVNIPSEEQIPIFHSLNKQFTSISKEKKEQLVEYIAKKLSGKENIFLTGIEDHTFTVPKRDTFLIHIARELYKKYGIEVNIENYVIKK